MELANEPTPAEVAELTDNLTSELKRESNDFRPEVRVLPVSLGRVFLSRHEDQRRQDPLAILRGLAQDAGLEVIEASTLTSGVTANVVQELKSCQGFIQVYGKRENDDESEVQWLIGEYSAAVALGLPAVSIVDLGFRDINSWKSFLRWDKDFPLIPFTSDWNRERLEEELREQMSLFIPTVMKQLQLQRSAG